MTATISLAVWAALSLAACLALHRARRSSPPEPVRDWYCTDGLWRTEAETVAWVIDTDGAAAESFGEPLYVPQDWVA